MKKKIRIYSDRGVSLFSLKCLINELKLLKLDIDIISANASTNPEGCGFMNFIIHVKNVDQLNKAIDKINKLKGVIKIKRIGVSEKTANTGGIK